MQGQDLGFHCCIAFLNFPRLYFISLGTSVHIFGPNLKAFLYQLKGFETEAFALIHKVFAL